MSRSFKVQGSRFKVLGLCLCLCLCGASSAWAITGFPSGNGVQIQDEGVSLAVRPTINYKGDGVVCVDNGATNAIDCTLTAGVGADIDQVGDCTTGECFMSTGTGTQMVWHGTTSGTLTLNAPVAAGTTTQTWQALSGPICVQSGTFTAGALPYVTTAGLLTQDATNLGFSEAVNTTGKLHIGPSVSGSNPNHKLTVTDDDGANSVVLGTGSGGENDLYFLTSGGTIASPTNSWHGSTGSLIFRGYIGGAYTDVAAITGGSTNAVSPTTTNAGAIDFYLGDGAAGTTQAVRMTSGGLSLPGATAKSFLYSDASKVLSTTSAPTNGQLLIGSTGNVPVAAALTGTANQVVVTNGAGSITLSLPQSIATSSTPSFSTVTSSVATGTAPFTVTSTTPVANLSTVPTTYTHSGTQQTGVHLVQDSCTLGTDCAVTLAGSAVFTNSTSYTCVCDDATALNACRVNQTSGSAFTVTGTGTDVIRYLCAGA